MRFSIMAHAVEHGADVRMSMAHSNFLPNA